MRSLTTSLAASCLALACGKGLDQFGPFPCGMDGTCPPTYICGGDVGSRKCYPEKHCDASANNSCLGSNGATATRCAFVFEPAGNGTYMTPLCVPPSPGGKPRGENCTFRGSLTEVGHVDECA